MSDEPIGDELLLSNEQVRVWADVVAPGAQQAVHTHRNPYLSVVLTDTQAQVLDPDGDVLYDVNRPAGDVTWFGVERLPMTHTLRNVGDHEVRVVIVELLGRT